MSDFIKEFTRAYGSKVAKNIAGTLSLDKKTVRRIIPEVVPLILGGLKKQKDEHGGVERVNHILDKYGNPDTLRDLAGLFREKAQEENPDPALGGLLGDAGHSAAQSIAKKFNIDIGTAMKLIPMLAPVVLAALTKKRNKRSVGTTGLSALLDRDGDGSILDDVAGFFLNNIEASRKKRGGIVEGLLKGLLKGGK